MRRIDSPALLVRSVPYGEADVVATFFTRDAGKMSAIVRGARRSTRRFSGALEPMHELSVVLEDRGRELCTLSEARIARPRTGIASSLEAMEAAGRALRWVRHVCPPRTAEPAAWRSLEALLDAIDEAAHRGEAEVASPGWLAAFGLELLSHVGYALELERCVRCGRACPEGRPAWVDAERGGLVCTTCGGARRKISGALRAWAVHRGGAGPLAADEAGVILAVVGDAMAAHAGFDSASGAHG